MQSLWFVCLQLAAADNVLVRPWGDNALRVQVSPSWWELTDALPTAYLPDGAPADGFFAYGKGFGPASSAPVISGNIKAEQDSEGLLVFSRISDSKTILKESGRKFSARGGGAESSVSFDFSSSASKLYGMGQNRHQNNGAGLGLNVINNSYTVLGSIGQEGGPSNSLPWVMGADPQNGGFQFGILFNSPTLGGVAFSTATMTWSIAADVGDKQQLRQQFDFLITTHGPTSRPEEKPFEIIEKYVDAVGHARKLPYPGYWHSKNRYHSQAELLEVARGFHNRSIPVDVIVIDYFHWKKFGDWSFDEANWPDPKAMVDECKSYGMEIMVSVWPFSCPGSRSYDTLVKNNWVTTKVGVDGERTNIGIETHGKDCRLVDPTNPDFRKYLWSLIESGYYQYGIKIFWLDASEPEGFGPPMGPALSSNASWQAGTMRDLGAMFTLYWTQAFYDGLRSHGETDIIMLPRSGWVGTWRHGGVLWSGDIGTTMDVLKGQMNIGLSAQGSGIPWWTTDVGGYHGGRAEDPSYHEIIVRWFQYGVTCPLFRQHGDRDHTAPWYYGNTTEKLLEDIIRLRGELKPYISSQLDLLSAVARPFNRPLMWDFPEDPKTWELAEHGIGDIGRFVDGHIQEGSSVADQYMMGDDYMVAPVLNLGQRSRQVYFPLGATWRHYFSGRTYAGGTTAVIDVPLENFALFKRFSVEGLIV